MASVLDRPRDPAGKPGSEVDAQIAQAASRIRVHDLTLGALVLVAMTLVYAAGMILLDKYLVLAEWVRQLALGGFVLAAVAVAYQLIVRPLRREVNPLYAAVQVEKTIEDAKNSVAGYVDAREKEGVHPTVRAALGARAARTARDADLNRAIDHRSLVYTGLVAVAFLLMLVVLFFVFRPAQFGSLVGRAFAPFSSGAIATRTQIEMVIPREGNTEIITGRDFTVRVEVSGKVPDRNADDRVRILFRQNQQAEYSVLPLEDVKDRVWQVVIPNRLVGYGIWYKIAAGDAETPEYAVKVRSYPGLAENGIEVEYRYPAYLRWDSDKVRDPNIKNAVAGTRVSVTARMNRPVQTGDLVLAPTDQTVPGQVVNPNATAPGSPPDSLRFAFPLVHDGGYRIRFTAADGEDNRNNPIGPYSIKLRPDLPPTVTIDSPKEDVIEVPANGQLAVDAAVGDDFGIDNLVLKMRVVEPAVKVIADVPYKNGESFRKKEADGSVSWPRSLSGDTGYKDSVDLTKLHEPGLRPGIPGPAIKLQEGMILEYWVEARDNRHVLVNNTEVFSPNVSKKPERTRRVRVTAPKVAPEEQKQIQQEKDERKTEEKQHNDNQQKKLDQEQRPRNQKDDPAQGNPQQQPADGKQEPKDGKQESKAGEGAGQPKGDNTPQGGPKNPEPKNNPPMGGTSDKTENQPPKKDGEKQPEPKSGLGGAGAPKDKEPSKDKEPPKDGTEPKSKEGKDASGAKGGEPKKQDGMPQPGGMTGGSENQAPKGPQPMEQAPMPKDQTRKELENKAKQIQDELDREKREQANGGDAKPAPQPQPKPEERTDPAKAKPPEAGKAADDAAPKPEPKPADPMNPMAGGNPAESKPAGEQPKSGEPPPAETKPQPQPEPKAGGEPMGMGQPKDKDGAAPAETKPQPQPQPKGMGPAEDKPAPEPKKGPDNTPMPGTTGTPEPKDGQGAKPMQDPAGGGMAKPAKPEGTKPEPGKPEPKSGDNNPGTGTEPKAGPMQPPKDGQDPAAGAAKSKPEPKPDRAADKPAPAEPKPGDADGDAKEPAGEAKPQQAPQPGSAKPAPKDGDMDQTAKAEPKPSPGPDGMGDPIKGEPAPAEAKPDPKGQPMGGTPKAGQEPDRGRDKPSPKPDDTGMARGGADQKLDPKQPKTPAGGRGEKVDPEDVKKTAQDLNSPHKDRRDAAKDKLDRQLGEENRKELEKQAGDLNSPDKDKKAAAEKKVEDLADKANRERDEKQAAGKQPGKPEPRQEGGKKVDPKEVEKAIEDLKSGDPKKTEDAKKKLDEQLGKGAGKKAQDAAKKLNEADGRKQAEGQKELDALKDQAEKQAKGEEPKDKGRELSRQELEELAKKARDLTSDDQQKREAAEQELDQKLGKEAREKLQKALKENKQPGDPQEEAKKELEKMERTAGPKPPVLNEGTEADAKNRFKSAELQLEKFKANKDNPDLLKRMGWTQKQYEDFLKDYEKVEVEQLKREAQLADTLPETPGPADAPAVNSNSGGRVGAAGATGGNPAAETGGGGAGFVPPGFEGAVKQFGTDRAKIGNTVPVAPPKK